MAYLISDVCVGEGSFGLCKCMRFMCRLSFNVAFKSVKLSLSNKKNGPTS
jgi:hypothetical protein